MGSPFESRRSVRSSITLSKAKPRTIEQRKGLSYFVVAFLRWLV